MNASVEAIKQFRKANKLMRLAFRKNGPKSFKRGQGALLDVLLKNDGITQRELVEKLGMSRKALKDIVKKAERNGYITIGEGKKERTYTVSLTAEGKKLAEKHMAAQDRTADEILSCLSDEEIKQLNAITEKLVLSFKDQGISAKKKGYKQHRHRHGHCQRRHQR